jgi:NitT/TauT family transport system substrate-binding protein
LRSAYTTASASQAPLLLAADLGLFAEQGLDAELSFISAGQAILGALSTQEAPLVVAGANTIVEANLQGGEYVLLGSTNSILTQGIWTVPTIQRPDDLRGKTLGSTRPASTSDQATHLLLGRIGLVPGRDVTIVHFGEIGSILAAMQQGLADAALLSAPTTLRARDMGFKEIVNLGDMRIPFVHDAIASSTRYARENPETVRRFLKAYIEAIKLTQEDKPLAMEAIGKYTRTEDVRFQDEAYDNVVGLLPRFPRVSEEVIQGVLDASQAPNAKTARAADFYDNSYVDALRPWADQLYQR